MKASQGQLDGYRFVRLSRIAGDSLIGLDNHVLYLFYASSFSTDDYFDSAEQVVFSKSQVQQLYKEDSIENVYRGYGLSTGFNRLK